jgi:uncharacterized protein YjbI with pentapeptide repeats
MSDNNQDELTPAEENIWYRLMTFHGVVENRWSGDGRATHAKNRELWHRWALPALTAKRIQAAGLSGLEPLTDAEQTEIAGVLDVRTLPDPAERVDMSSTHFSLAFMAGGLVFPRWVYFSKAHFNAVADFSEVRFNDGAFFGAAHFDDTAYFSKAHFDGDTWFSGAYFDGGVDFSASNFDANVYFGDAHFPDSAYFNAAYFHGGANFIETYFDADADFSDCGFSGATDFIGATFLQPPLFHQASLHQDTSFHAANFSGARAVAGDRAARAWQRLKVIMNEGHAHDQELRFFGYELSVRGRMARWPVNWLYGLYEGLSDYGRSMGRPVLGLAMLTLLFGLFYYVGMDRQIMPDRGQYVEDVASFTMSNVLPAVGGLNPARRDLYQRLFNPDEKKSGIDIPFGIELLSIVQASSGIVLFFLLSLGIRNRFRIK